MEFEDNYMLIKFFRCNKESKTEFNMDVINKIKNTYEFCGKGINKFIFLLRKCVYPYEYMDSWERFDETKLPSIDKFYSNLKLEKIIHSDCRHANRVFKKSKLKYMGEYRDLYVNSDNLLLFDVFENFRNTCIEINELDPSHFLSASELGWKACLRKTGVKLELLTDVDMLLMVEKGIRGGICHAVYRYSKANNQYMKNYDKNKHANNLYGWEMSQKLPVDGFKWKKNMSKFNEDVIKNDDEDIDKGYIIGVGIESPKDLNDLQSDLPFLSERMKINKCSKLVCNLYDKNNYVAHIISLKQASNYGLILKKVHRVIQFN